MEQPTLLANTVAWDEARREMWQRQRLLPPELGVALFARLHVAPESFVIREDEIAAAGTLCRRLVVEPAVWLDELLVALRAGDLDAVARFAHGGSFQ